MSVCYIFVHSITINSVSTITGMIQTTLKALFCAAVLTCALALDTNPFIRAVESTDFVDKTSMIKALHRYTAPILVTAPRYFGKTTTLYMLRTFYEIQVDGSGAEMPKNRTRNYAVFSSLVNRERICNRTVFEEGRWCIEQMATLPVLQYTFENVSVGGVTEFLESFRQLTARVCKEHAYLLKSDRLSSENKTLLRSYCDAPASGVTRLGLAASARDLSALLAAHFGRPCMVLLDDLDAPVLKLLTSSAVTEDDMREILAVLREFSTELFVNNSAVARAFLMGNTRLAATVAPSNVIHWQFTEDEEIAHFFGFSEKELEFLIRDTKLQQKDIRMYYDGYRGQNSSTWVYNPYSLRHHLRRQWKSVYWSGALPLETFAILYKKNEFVRGIFNSGVSMEEIKVTGPHSFTVEEQIALLREMLLESKLLTTTAQRAVFVEFLYELGYFTDKTVFPWSKSDRYFLVITPNKEVSEIFARFSRDTKIS